MINKLLCKNGHPRALHTVLRKRTDGRLYHFCKKCHSEREKIKYRKKVLCLT